MEYKRLTNNNLDEYNPEYDFCVGCEHFGEPNGCNRSNGTGGNYERFMETYNRLVELEDKIEQGTLIELPCKVGDKFYQVVKGLPIYEWEVETIVFSNIYFPKNYVITARRTKDLAFWKFWSEDFGETVFLTREEAEKRLEELKK